VKITVAFENALLEMGLILFVVLVVAARVIWLGDTRGGSAFASFQAKAQDAAIGRRSHPRKTLQFRKKRRNFRKAR
jgi:hypothetical protein